MKINGIGKAALLTVATVSPQGAVGLNEKVRGDDLTNLPWSDLSTNLSSPDILVDTTPADYVSQCIPEFEKDPIDRNHLNLLNQPSGLCTNAISSAFQDCTPVHNMSWFEWWAEEKKNPTHTLAADDLPTWSDPTNPLYNLPSKVLFPTVASDAAAAVDFAKLHNVELSIKNSGHHYMGASTKKDTLHMNMNKYKQYTVNGPIECDQENFQDAAMEEDLSNQACKLALARGRQAILRIGGGENWEKAYGAIKAFNEAQPDGYKYHVIGGACGSVSPMGWTWQAGLASTTLGRKYGLGVDQVIQVEMILPNGLHVRFGPTDWENSDGFYYPKTTKVSGVCNENTNEDDESLWDWKACPEDIDFDDLWFAVRGGGGGTWGVVLSVHVQLHDYTPLEYIQTPAGFLDDMQLQGVDVPPAFANAAWEFMFDFMWNPSALGLSDDDSNNCGNSFVTTFYCYGEGSGAVLLTAWKGYIMAKKTTLLSLGVPPALIDDSIVASPTMYKDFAEEILLTEGPYEGKAIGVDRPEIVAQPGVSANFLVPKKCILENRDFFLMLLPFPFTKYLAFGVNPGISNDQTTSVSDAYHNAGLQLHLGVDDPFGVYVGLMQLCYETGDKDNFPPIYGSNHAGPNLAGPLKSNWTLPCPTDWTHEKMESDCISIQEAIYGTKLLKRLEEIKNTIDPTYMFDCKKCIGNKRVDPNPDPVKGASSASSMQVFFHLILVGAFASIL